MNWRKLGKVFCSEDNDKLMKSYGRMPTQLNLEGDIYRIYFESRCENNTARPYYLDIDLQEMRILRLQTKPFLSYGRLGTFDDNGITPFTALVVGGDVWLYYAGWNRMHNVPFRNAIGLAISKDGGESFEKYSDGPILAQDRYDPIFPTGPQVLHEDGKWKMWYTSFEKWETNGSDIKHYYNIKCRESEDGINWNSEPKVAIDFQNEDEYAFVCRSVIKQNGSYRMWYSFREQPGVSTYRVGYAESVDGISWQRKDHMAGIDVSESGWDSDMICYPRVFPHQEKLYMLYNGNGYGQSGFGLAVLES